MLAMMTSTGWRWHGPISYALPMLLLLVAVVLLLEPADAYDPEDPATWNWTIAGETVEYRNGTVLLDENITVKDNSKLSLVNVTLVFNCSFPGDYGILVEAGGELFVMDGDNNPATMDDASVISARFPMLRYGWVCEADSVLLIRNSHVRDCGPRTGSGGLLIETDNAFISNTTITNGYYGLVVKGGYVLLQDVIISDHATYGVIVEASQVMMERCLVQNTTHRGINIHDTSSVYIKNSTVKDHGMTGLLAVNSRVYIEDCDFVNCTEYGIDLRQNASGLIARCIIDDMPGVSVNLVQANGVDVIDCQISRADVGVRLYYAESIRILRTLFDNGTMWGIHSFNSPPVIMDSTFEGCAFGIAFSNSDPFTVTRCTFQNNSHGIISTGTSNLGSRGIIENCTFRSNDYSGITVESHSGASILNGTFRDHGRWAINCNAGGVIGWYVGGVSSAVNDTIKLAGTIKVQYGGNLSLINTTLVVDDMDADGPIDVYYNGILWLLDGDGDPDTIYDETRFVHTNPGPLDHYYVGGQGNIVARNAVFDSMTLFSVDGNLTAEGCDFQETKYGIYIFNYAPGNAAYVSDCTFADSMYGISAENTPIQVTNCTFSRCTYGVSLRYCDGASLSDLRFINCGKGVSLKGGDGIVIQDISTLGCRDGIYSTEASDVTVKDSIIRQSEKHGLRFFSTNATLEDCEVTTSGSGGIVADDSRLTLDRCTIHSNERAGLMGNYTYLHMALTSVTDTNGIGIWWRDDASLSEEVRFTLIGCFLDTGAAYDIRLEEETVGTAYNTHLDPSDVRILGNSSLRVLYDLYAEVKVVGMEPVPPPPVTFEVVDRIGTMVGLGTMTDPTRLPTMMLTAFTMTSLEMTTYVPYVVTVTVAGREWSNSTDLGVGRTTTVWVELDLTLVIDFPEDILEGLEVTLDASGSLCYPFGLAEVGWDMDPDTSPGTDLTGETVSWTYPAEGSYEVRVTITDSAGNTNQMVLQITVEDSTAVAEIITEVPDTIVEDEPLVLEGRYTSAVDEVIILEWDFGDGMKANGASVTHTWTREGEYNVTFTVVEADGSYTEEVIHVSVVNMAPVAVLRNDVLEVGKRERFDLDGSLSYDTPSDNGTLKYMWDMGGDPFLTGAQAFWRFEEAGVYEINLMVVDDGGAWDKATMTITVFNRPPTFGPIPDVRLNDTDKVWLFKLPISDPDDDLANLTINNPEFEPGGAFNMQIERDSDGGWVLFVKPIKGREGSSGVVTLTVRDGDGGKASSTVEIFVERTPVDTSSILWLIIAAALVLVVLTVVYYRMARRQVPPPPPQGGEGA